ncbi:leucyl/phenylalanyl-tRNA--protein transferase [Rhodohalobacter sp. SW132]|uniref:leucyl/phenylalanyl-tRNA--protein transferase n=1 Tax=Rhodohalobacter sp. SW132 TaxID=2293433 RepID=UPI000E282DB9|nr:leucyl/phenylalanyl-tRNA--protein transferase [Rhodohalobacter sp. SW132]REL38570.1 leucyl/phenylalanyl-tRNA--protein transferase [Rhodohalobacter sp. SW132]
MHQNSENKIIPPEALLDAYSRGVFPMSESRDDKSVNWYSARQRGIIPMDRFRVSGNVRRIIRQGRFTCRINTNFKEVMKQCASRNTTWISDIIIRSFEVLHMAGHAHSVEMYDEKGTLAGGLYGVSLGGAFFGESMFKHQKEADKVALCHCHRILEKNGFTLWDTQFYTGHLAQFGCIEISSKAYEESLEKALQKEVMFRD